MSCAGALWPAVLPRVSAAPGAVDWRASPFAAPPADDLRLLLESKEPPAVVDLRSDVTRGAVSIPGARAVAPRELPRWAEGIPRDKEIVVACD